MFIIRKKNLIIISCFLAIIVTLIVCVSSINTTPKVSSETRVFNVVLDAGHGGIDGGVTGVNTGVKESDINLSITKKLMALLINANINVTLTRSTDAGLYGLATGNLKKKDMQKRKEIIEKANPDIVISIHQNKYSLSSRRGAQVFYKESDEKGKVLAQSIQNNFNDMEEATRTCQILSGDYYILNCTNYPSVICECGFLSNSEDEKLLVSAEYQEKISYTIFKGIVDYFANVN